MVTAGKKKKNTAAPDARHRAAEQQANVTAARAASRQSVPEAVESWEVAAVVGKSKVGKMKKAFWKTSGGQLLCSKDDCTWSNESSTFFGGGAGALQPVVLSAAEITCEASGVIYNARIGMRAPNGLCTHHCSCDLMFVGRAGEYNISFISKDCGTRTRKKDLMVDLELPRAAKLSLWRLSGYSTRPNSDNEAAEGEGESENDDESESESSDEE